MGLKEISRWRFKKKKPPKSFEEYVSGRPSNGGLNGYVKRWPGWSTGSPLTDENGHCLPKVEQNTRHFPRTSEKTLFRLVNSERVARPDFDIRFSSCRHKLVLSIFKSFALQQVKWAWSCVCSLPLLNQCIWASYKSIIIALNWTHTARVLSCTSTWNAGNIWSYLYWKAPPILCSNTAPFSG